ncbi:hypothetical protein HMPREF1547_02736 [Blautia sp. KLE 1732]|nr:hypothetical protein HMPREF1547_02736 [Blautia sp. KLE 1732]
MLLFFQHPGTFLNVSFFRQIIHQFSQIRLISQYKNNVFLHKKLDFLFRKVYNINKVYCFYG